MNVLIIIVAGVSAGWATHKLYHAVFTVKKSGEDFDSQIAEENKELTKKESRVDNNSAKEKDSVVVVKEKTAKKEESTSLKEGNVDDLSQLKGVGPKLAEALDEIGIQNYEQLSDSSIELLIIRLREVGGKFSRPAISAVVERAKLAIQER